MVVREKLVQVLERGKEAATHIMEILDHDHDEGSSLKSGQVGAHSLVVFTSFANALFMLHNFPTLFDDQNRNLKRPNPTLDHHHHHHHDYHFKTEGVDDWEASNSPKEGRGCYKRRKSEKSVAIETSNTEDGYAWRKYGQKAIQHSKHPRNYYRCTHKTEQKCQATKQVQQISENPVKYKIIYYGHHTCQNLIKNPNSMYLDFIDEEINSPNLLSFRKPTKHGLSPFMFPSPSPSTASASASSSLTSSPTTPPPVKEEMTTPSPQSDRRSGAHIQCPSSPDFPSTSSDFITTITASTALPSTPVFYDVISLDEIYSSAFDTHGMEEDNSLMMTEFADVFQDYPLFP